MLKQFPSILKCEVVYSYVRQEIYKFGKKWLSSFGDVAD